MGVDGILLKSLKKRAILCGRDAKMRVATYYIDTLHLDKTKSHVHTCNFPFILRKPTLLVQDLHPTQELHMRVVLDFFVKECMKGLFVYTFEVVFFC